jgi:hypothetical protein
VSNRTYGKVRVRTNAWDDILEVLETAQKAVQGEYACVITCGSGNYADRAELLVFPKPLNPNFHGFRNSDKDKKKPLLIKVACVREDVWQGLLGIKFTNGFDREWKNSKSLIEEARNLWLSVNDPEFRLPRRGEDRFLNGIPFQINLRAHWSIAVRAFKAGELTVEEGEEFANSHGEFAFLRTLMSLGRYSWRPSANNGPQYGEWGVHTKLNSLFARISRGQKRKEKEKEREWAAIMAREKKE